MNSPTKIHSHARPPEGEARDLGAHQVASKLPEALWLLLLALLAMLVLGYHPFAEDGGIYAAAVAARIDPTLFPHDHLWVTAHTGFALFVPATAALARVLHLSSSMVLFALHATGLLLLLIATAHLARTCVPGQQRPWLATLAIACMAGLPVAGTSLYAVDPYCTARTLTTPLLLLALSFALRKCWSICSLLWIGAATMHPLMALWALLPLLTFAASSTRHPRRATLALTFLLFSAAALLVALSPPETTISRTIAHTRAYWFPAQWRWYEWAGAAAPCSLLFLLAGLRTSAPRNNLRQLATVALTTTVIASALALIFAREGATSLAIARLQPLRCLHLIFIASLAAGGAALQTWLNARPRQLLGIVSCAVAAASVFAMQHSLFRNTPHLEWPGRQAVNPWQAAFVWCRDNTSPGALFALDSKYIDQPGEDSHGFRAVALRSALPDRVKDAGIAAVIPALSASWQASMIATDNLNQVTDAQRQGHLLPLGVTWIVLPASALTRLPCPYRNSAAQVCRLTTDDSH